MKTENIELTYKKAIETAATLTILSEAIMTNEPEYSLGSISGVCGFIVLLFPSKKTNQVKTDIETQVKKLK